MVAWNSNGTCNDAVSIRNVRANGGSDEIDTETVSYILAKLIQKHINQAVEITSQYHCPLNVGSFPCLVYCLYQLNPERRLCFSPLQYAIICSWLDDIRNGALPITPSLNIIMRCSASGSTQWEDANIITYQQYSFPKIFIAVRHLKVF